MKISKILFYFVTFFFIFGPKRGAFLDSINLISIFVIFFGFKHLYFKEFEKWFLFFCFILMLHFQIIITFNGAMYDVWHLFQTPRFIINVLATLVYVRIAISKNIELLRIISDCIFFHACIVIVGSFEPSLKFFIYDITGMVDKSPIRFAGFTNSYSIPAVMHFFGILIILTGNLRPRAQYVEFIQILVLLISQVFLARMGLVFSLSFLVAFFFIRMTIKQRLYSIFAFSLSIYLLSYELFFPEQIIEAFKHSSEIFLLLGQADQINSLNTIQDFSFHNQTILEIIFGSGHYGRGDDFYHLYTDISWAHYFSLAGIIGIGLIIAIYFLPLIFLKENMILNLTMILTIFVANYKEAFIFVRGLSIIWLLVLFISLYQKNSRAV